MNVYLGRHACLNVCGCVCARVCVSMNRYLVDICVYKCVWGCIRVYIPYPSHRTHINTHCTTHIGTVELVHTLKKHMHPVIALDFSSNGSLLATLSHDRLHVWSVREGEWELCERVRARSEL
jgi:WD40 repeat protein